MKFIKTISIIIAHYRKKEKNGRNILSADTYIELFRNTIHGIMGNIESEISAGMRGKAPICYGRWNMDSLLRIFPQKRRDFWKVTADKAQEVCEIRLRVDRPVIIETSRGDFFLDHSGIWREEPYGAYSVTETEIRDLIAYLCQDSVYAYSDEIRQGFLTVEGGHRIGLSGQAVLENENSLRTLKNISFVNIRVAHEIRGVADKILPELYKAGRFQNTLIVSPPGFGKTTLLRDLIRQLSDGNAYGPGLRVGVVDERSELAGSYRGRPQNDLGMRTDVLDACPKALGMLLLLRSMSPQVIAVDELGEEQDLRVLHMAASGGCSLLATVHGSGEADAARRLGGEYMREMFARIVILKGRGRMECRCLEGG